MMVTWQDLMADEVSMTWKCLLSKPLAMLASKMNYGKMNTGLSSATHCLLAFQKVPIKEEEGLLTLTNENFAAHIKQGVGIHFVDFYAPWCVTWLSVMVMIGHKLTDRFCDIS
jgi:thiol:disulfide interchange protein